MKIKYLFEEKSILFFPFNPNKNTFRVWKYLNFVLQTLMLYLYFLPKNFFFPETTSVGSKAKGFTAGIFLFLQ